MMHLPVLLERVVELLALRPGANVLDCTVDGGGYAEVILEATAPSGTLLGLDADPSMLEISRARLERFGRRVWLRELNFRHLRIAAGEFGQPIHAVVADLGLSSLQLEDPARGFSFLKEGPLDMRFSPKGSTTAANVVNQWSEVELRRVLWQYGQERAASRIARAIADERKRARILTTEQLANIVSRCIRRTGKLHPATRTFQALRIATNDELGALADALPQMLECLVHDGRMAILSYHSLEDRIVKNFFKDQANAGHMKLMTKKPLTASRDEIKRNPRARSAKLRVAMKCSFVLLLMLAVGYLAIVNDSTTIGYALASTQSKKEKLIGSAERLEVELARLERWDVLEPKMTALGLVERGGVRYAHTLSLHAFAGSQGGAVVAR